MRRRPRQVGLAPALVIGFLALPGGAREAEGQAVNLIDQEIEGALEASLWRAGPFRLTPLLRLGGGYDGNGLSSPDAPQPDVTFSAAPGLRAVVPLGGRALIDVTEELRFVYYRELAGLRDVFGVTRLGAAVGSRTILLRIHETFSTEKARASTEFDVPVDLESRRLGAELAAALGWRHELSFAYQNQRSRIVEDAATGLAADRRLDRDHEVWSARLTRSMTARTSAVVEGFRERVSFIEELPQGRPRGYGLRGGAMFSPRGNVKGQVLLGFRSVAPEFPGATVPDFKGFTSAVDAQFRFGRRVGLGAIFKRDLEPSVLEDNWYFVDHQYGGSLEIFITRGFSIQPRIVFGRNTYPRPVRFVDRAGETVERRVDDRFATYSLGFNYRFSRDWSLGLMGSYLIRESDIPSFQKNRFLVNLGVSRGF